jgi:hypothetical protein
MTYAIGQKVAFAPHHQGAIFLPEPYYVRAKIEHGSQVTYEIASSPDPGTLRYSCARPDMLKPWEERP